MELKEESEYWLQKLTLKLCNDPNNIIVGPNFKQIFVCLHVALFMHAVFKYFDPCSKMSTNFRSCICLNLRSSCDKSYLISDFNLEIVFKFYNFTYCIVLCNVM